MNQIKLAPWQLSLLASIYIVAANNGAIFSALGSKLALTTIDGISFLLTVILLLLFTLNSIFLVLYPARLQKAVIAVFFIGTAIFAYFSNDMGVVFDEEMFRNVAETVRDNNSAEALELASLPLIMHVLIVGIIPSLLLVFVGVSPRPFLREIGTRILVTVTGLALLTGVALPNYKYISYFAVENRDLRFKVMPVYPLISIVRVTRDKFHTEPPFRVIDADARQVVASVRRSVGIMVVGETARADHFSLGGYAKDTNPNLDNMSDVVFVQGTSCGTSTLFSVPCMFSMQTRTNYDPDKAASESNVLDILSSAGVKTVWIDNNSSCKHVCDRIENINLRQDLDESSPYYSDMGYFDEALLDNIDRYLDSDGPDLLLVLHTLGSHGPAYSRRYPDPFGVFAPYCDKASPKECSDELVVNAYDNTILYTDYILQQLIQKLRDRSDQVDSFLFYASDHGESLGENGVYLHGLPYSIAPSAQTEIPFIFWMSNGFQRHRGLGSGALAQFNGAPRSHDNISHTLLGLFDVSANSYRPELDIFRRPGLALGQNVD